MKNNDIDRIIKYRTKIVTVLFIIVSILLIGTLLHITLNKNISNKAETIKTDAIEDNSDSTIAKQDNDKNNNKNLDEEEIDLSDIEITDEFDINNYLNNKLPIIIFFGRDGCPACDEIKPIIIKYINLYKDVVTFRYCDTRKNKDILDYFPLKSVPAQAFFNTDGTPFTIYNADIQDRYRLNELCNDSGDRVATIREGTFKEEEFDEILKLMNVEIIKNRDNTGE